jgi:hypothetical protein
MHDTFTDQSLEGSACSSVLPIRSSILFMREQFCSLSSIVT